MKQLPNLRSVAIAVSAALICSSVVGLLVATTVRAGAGGPPPETVLRAGEGAVLKVAVPDAEAKCRALHQKALSGQWFSSREARDFDRLGDGALARLSDDRRP